MFPAVLRHLNSEVEPAGIIDFRGTEVSENSRQQSSPRHLRWFVYRVVFTTTWWHSKAHPGETSRDPNGVGQNAASQDTAASTRATHSTQVRDTTCHDEATSDHRNENTNENTRPEQSAAATDSPLPWCSTATRRALSGGGWQAITCGFVLPVATTRLRTPWHNPCCRRIVTAEQAHR